MKNKRFKILLSILFISIFFLYSSVYATDDIIVILDPGHGGNDVGAVSNGIRESDVNWKIAKKVKEILDNTSGITGILTRTEWENPSLYDRGLLARKSGADLLVSFHINANTSPYFSGSETYITGDINSPRFYEASKTLGESVLAELRKIGINMRIPWPILKPSNDGELYSDGFISDYYGIIRNPMYYGIPGVLIEHCYITNQGDRNNYLNDAKIEEMAKADATAIILNKEKFRINREKNSVNSEITELKMNATKTHLVGEIVVVDWINGMQAVPIGNPSIKLKSTDGKSIINCYVSQKSGNTYYFDIKLANINSSKEYKIEVSTTDKVNIPVNHTMNPTLGKNRTLGEDKLYYYSIENKLLKVKGKQYVGNINSELKTFKVDKNNKGATYVSGEIVVVEWVNGKSTVPNKKPIMRFKSTDNTTNMEVFVTATGTNTYYFDRFIEGIDTSKEYYFEIESGDINNISENRKMNVYFTKTKYNDKIVGKYRDKNIRLLKQKILFEDNTYVGNINSELKIFKVGKNEAGATYVSGEIVVVEWVNGKSTVPEEKPIMKFRSIDGTVELEVFVTATGTNTYYFDRFIEGIDTSKEYYFEIKSGDSRNISPNKSMNVYFTKTKYNNTIVGYYKNKQIRLVNKNIKFEDYQDIYITKNGIRYHYDETCNGGTYILSTLKEALQKGLTPCEKCVN